MTGLLILFVAQVLSAIMGIYVQNTYQAYGPHWNENLFYSHVLSLPLFIPFLPSLYRQFLRLADSRLFTISFNISETLACFLGRSGPPDITKSHTAVSFSMPIQVIMLAANSLTQYACITGVNLLGARTTALGVTVVLNLRKLVSLFASIWLFGNELPRGVLLGAGVVFLGAGVYASETGSKKKATSKPKAKAT